MDDYVKLAKSAVEEYIKNGSVLSVPANLPEEFNSRQAGIFVTIHKGEELRGCIGTFLPVRENIAQEIIYNAVSSCSQDYRFRPITKEELPELSYEVSILNKPQKVKDVKELDPKKYGVIVRSKDGRSGLLLPDLEGVNNTEQQIYIACQKGNINPQNDSFALYCFTTEKHV